MEWSVKYRRYTWRKKEPGHRMRSLPAYTLHYGSDVVLAIAQQLPSGEWYWYGDGKNTAQTPRSRAVVQDEAMNYWRNRHA
jgi:hypothetical protein